MVTSDLFGDSPVGKCIYESASTPNVDILFNSFATLSSGSFTILQVQEIHAAVVTYKMLFRH